MWNAFTNHIRKHYSDMANPHLYPNHHPKTGLPTVRQLPQLKYESTVTLGLSSEAQHQLTR